MPLHVFEAENQSLAMEAMAAALGPDALVVSGRQSEGRFRLTAAPRVEEEDLADLLVPPLQSETEELLEWVCRFHRLPARITERLRKDKTELNEGANSLANQLQNIINFTPLASNNAGSKFALVGMPGSGKTAVCARLALASRLKGQSPLIASLDQQKTGGTAQLEGLLAAMELQLTAIPEKNHGDHPLFVDVGGSNPYSDKSMADLSRQLEALDAEPILVFDAVSDANDADDVARAFLSIGVNRAIVTRLDLCRRLGSVLSLASRGMSLAGATVSPMIAKPVLPLSANGLERLLLRHRAPS